MLNERDIGAGRLRLAWGLGSGMLFHTKSENNGKGTGDIMLGQRFRAWVSISSSQSSRVVGEEGCWTQSDVLDEWMGGWMNVTNTNLDC